MAARATTPPATLPAIAEVYDLPSEDEEDGEEVVRAEEAVEAVEAEEEEEEDALDREAVEVVGLTLPEAEAPVPINEPGSISGVSEEKTRG